MKHIVSLLYVIHSFKLNFQGLFESYCKVPFFTINGEGKLFVNKLPVPKPWDILFFRFSKLFSLMLIKFHGFVGWQRQQTYLHDETDVIPQSWGRDFLSQILFYSVCYRQIGNQHFCQTLIFYYGFMVNRLVQNVRNDSGMISGFYRNHHLDRRFGGQRLHFPPKRDFHFVCLDS